MTRDEVLTLIQTHLADELELDPARILDVGQAIDFVLERAPAAS